MREILTQRSEKHTEGFRLTTIAQASLLLREIAEPRPVGDTVKAAITRVARRVSAHLPEPMSYGRAEDLWRREARRIDAAEMDAIRAAHERRQRSLRDEVRAAEALAKRLERLAAAAMEGDDPSRAGEVRGSVNQARRAARVLRQIAEERSAELGR